MSIIRYRYKADKNFESVKIDGMSCSLGELKRLIAAKSSRPGTHQPKHDYDLIISNANTNEEYKDNSDLIPRNASVIVARRIRGTSEALTPSSIQRPVTSSDDIVTDIFMPALFGKKKEDPILNMPPVVVESNPAASEKIVEPSNNTTTTTTKEMTEDDLIREIQQSSHARYVTTQTNYRTNLFVCHNCKQPGHMKNQCPLLLQSANSTTSGTSSSTPSSTIPGASSATAPTGDSALKTDGIQSNNIGPSRPTMPHSSNIYTRPAPYSTSYHHPRGGRSHRGSGHPRGEPVIKKATGIPRDRLITVPKHIPGALKDPTGASVVPRQMAELYVERIEKKTNSSTQLAKQSDGKNFGLSATGLSRSSEDDPPPQDLLCPLCKQVCNDAVITPCCNFSFCDECIRTALIESPDHTCPHCRRQHVAIDQINPNLFLRNHVNRWRERQNQISYSHIPISQSMPQKVDSDFDNASRLSHEPADEYDAALLSTNSEAPAAVPPVKTAPIVIRMQPIAKIQPAQPVVSTRPADMTFEDEKTTDTDHIVSSQKSNSTFGNSQSEEPIPIRTETLPSSNSPEHEKSESETPPSQPTPLTPVYPPSSPSTTHPGTAPMVPHYFPPTGVPPHHGLAPPLQPNPLYPHHIPPGPSNGLYPIQPNYYPPSVGIRFPPNVLHGYPPYAPGPPIHHHPPPPTHHPHPIMAPLHVANNSINGYTVPPFPHAGGPFAATSTSTFITHHQTATQPISNALTTALSEDEFYIKQRYLQRIQGSTSHGRSRSRSSSYSSYSSSDSRSSSRSRHRRYHSRSSRSRSRRRIDTRRTKSPPNRNDRRQRRSSSYRNRRATASTRENYSSKYRRSSPRRSRERERRRSPRPPPTVQQSTQRTIVYMHESSHTGRDKHRRSKSRSRGTDDRRVSSSKTESKSQSDSTGSVAAPPTLSSTIETVPSETTDKIEKDDRTSANPSIDETSSKSGKKHKKHHKKHRRQGSKSKKHRRSKEKDKKSTVDTSSAVVQVQS